MAIDKICFTLDPNCDECAALCLEYCPTTITISAGLTPASTPYIFITTPLETTYRDQVTVANDGSFEIDQANFPKGIFSPYFGALRIIVTSDSAGTTIVPMTFDAIEYNCLSLSFEEAVSFVTTDPEPVVQSESCPSVPSFSVQWGNIFGDILNQTDLIEYIATHGGSLTCNNIDQCQTIIDIVNDIASLTTAIAGLVPNSRTITINGVTYDLSQNRSWTVSGLPTQTGNNGKWLTTDGTSASWSAITTDNVSEGTNLYFTEARARATVLTGLSITGSAILSTDTILQALGKAQNQINALAGGVNYQGTWNANTNTPALASGVGTKGYYYVVSVAGSTNLDGITDWKLGDWAIFNGATWEKVDNTDAVISVNGYTGIVTLTTSDISEGINLYWTSARFDTAFATKSTTNLSEGTNLYYTNARADARISAAIGVSVQAYDADLSAIAALGFTSTAFLTKTAANTWALDTNTYLTTSSAASTYQPLDSDLTTIAGLTATTDNFIVSVANAWASRTPAQVRTTLALVIGTNVQAWDADLDSIAALGFASTSFLKKTAANTWALDTNTYLNTANNLSDLGNAVTARSNLGAPFTIFGFNGVFSPADSTTYYSGIGGIAPSTTAANQDFNLGYAYTIIGLVILVANNTTAGTNENITVQFRNTTQATSTSIGTFTSDGGSSTVISPFSFTGLSISVASGDSGCLQFDTPAWATNPVSTTWRYQLLCVRA